jgi:hypothetical protein
MKLKFRRQFTETSPEIIVKELPESIRAQIWTFSSPTQIWGKYQAVETLISIREI